MPRSDKKAYVLSSEKLLRWQNLLELRTGIHLVEQQKALLQTQIVTRMRELGVESDDDYYDYVNHTSPAGFLEWQELVDRFVVTEAPFFRHRPSLDVVRQYIQNKVYQSLPKKHFDILSLGCSTGEEAYSLAIVANECVQGLPESSYFGVTGVDISLSALTIARRGVYGHRSLSLLTDTERSTYFRHHDNGQFEVLPRLKKRVCFLQANIHKLGDILLQKSDLVFCQNVLIYFRRWRRRDLLNQLIDCLNPGGLLVIGLGEAADWQHQHMQRVENDEVQAYVKSV